MAHIPDSEIERLKQEISIQRLAEGMGIVLKSCNQELRGLCPFHEDHDPSLFIHPVKNLFHCKGCGANGSPIDWVIKAEGVSFRHAVELLQVDYRPLAASSGAVKRSTIQKLPTTLESSAEDARLLVQVVDYYHETLKQSPEALAYLEKRGIANSEAIDRFKLGFANRTLGYRLPAKNRKEGAAIRGQLQRLGLYRASGHEHFTGSIVFPIISETGQVTEIYGRKITDRLRKGTPIHCYLPGPHQGIWNVEALQASKEIILCESLIDALTFWCAGYRNVTASYGVEGFTTDHIAAFKQHGTERVLIAYDRDEAGNHAAEKLAQQLIESGIDGYRIQFPKGMDANEYALHVKPATKSLGVVIRSAIWIGKGTAKPMTTEAVTGESIPILIPKSESSPQEPDITSESELKEDPVPSLTAKVENHEPLPAVVVPDIPKADIPAEISDREIIIALGDRRYRIRGLEKNLAFDVMKINLLVSRPAFDGVGETIHVDTFDLYQQRPRGTFIKQAAIELGVKDDVIKADLGKILLKLETLQTDNIQAAQAPKDQAVTLDDAETQAALDLLKSPDLLERIRNDFTRCGVVGEDINKWVGYLAVISRKLDAPLAVTIQSTSAAGKSALMDAILAFMPEEERIKYSAMTGQSLFYMGETDLQHKVLAIVEEEGVSNAAYALKLLQSEGETNHRQYRQGPGNRRTQNPGLPGQRPGDDHAHHHGDRHRRRTAQSLHCVDCR